MQSEFKYPIKFPPLPSIPTTQRDQSEVSTLLQPGDTCIQVTAGADSDPPKEYLHNSCDSVKRCAIGAAATTGVLLGLGAIGTGLYFWLVNKPSGLTWPQYFFGSLLAIAVLLCFAGCSVALGCNSPGGGLL